MNRLISIEKLGIGVSSAERTSDATSFKPIGVGKPLLVRFHTLYPGKLDKGLLSGGKKSILITSMIKDDITFDIPPKNMHQIFRDVEGGKTLQATGRNQGSEIIYYSRALDETKLNLSIEVKLDKFNEKLLKDISKLMTKTAGMPILAGAAPYVVIGSKIISVGADLINNINNKEPLLSYELNIVDDIAGLKDTKADWLIGVDDENKEDFKGYEVVVDEKNRAYLAKDGKEYKGEHPYMLCTLDGKKEKKYDGYKAMRASSSVLEQFYGVKDEKNIEIIGNMFSIYNDYEYVKKIRALEKPADDASEEDKNNYITLLEAYKANIMNEDILRIAGS